jgi:spoIIIJ-associated protein
MSAGNPAERAGGSANEPVEVRARTVDEAIARGLVRMGGLSRAEVDIEVVSEGKAGLLGFGAEEAVVRLRPKGTSTTTATEPGSAAGSTAGTAPRGDTSDGPSEAPRMGRRLRRGRRTRGGRTDIDRSGGTSSGVPPTADDPARRDRDDAVESGARRPEREGGARTKGVRTPPSATRAAASEERVRPDMGAESPAATGEPTGADAQPKRRTGPVQLLGEGDDPLTMARNSTARILSLLGFEGATLETQGSLLPDDLDDEESVVLCIRGDATERLLVDEARPLRALQFLTRMIISRKTDEWNNLIIDVQDDRRRQVKELIALARQSADLVETDGRPVSLPPMGAYERRVVHMALRDHPMIATQSIGRGDRRKVTVRRRDQLLPDL